MTEEKQYAIYGAGVVAYQTYVAIKELYGVSPVTFFVTKTQKEKNVLDGIPIKSIDTICDIERKLFIVVATPEIYHEQILQTLKTKNITRYYCIDTKAEYNLMGRYFRKTGKLLLVEDLSTNQRTIPITKKDVTVFMTRTHKDISLSGAYEIPDWVIPMQAGSAQAESLGIMRDDEGDNISCKNANYCELTVTYWAWKNYRSTYKGVCHYRRMIRLNEREIQAVIRNDIDIILPLPFVCWPGAAGQYRRYISENDLQGLWKALEKISPEYLKVWKQMDKQQLFYDYNMMIAKEEVFDTFCEWMFRVLRQAEIYCEPKGIKRADRYAGHLGELLTTLYIIGNQERLKIVHGEKVWMV